MKKNKILVLSVCLVLSIALGVCISAKNEAVLSPGIAVLEERARMIKTGIRGYDIDFTSGDFLDALGVKSVDGIKITSLPDAQSGVLKLGAIDVLKGQTISASALSSLRFLAGEDEYAEFEFVAVGTENERCVKCSLFVLDGMNFSPRAESSSIKTEAGITVFAKLSGTDPENDPLTIEISSDPSHGTVRIIDAESGEISYTPSAGYRGTDRFFFTVTDKYGNTSAPASAVVKIEKSSGIYFADMGGHPAHYAALKLTKDKIMSVQKSASALYFEPDGNVSREEFTVMAMKALGFDSYIALSTGTPFADDGNISAAARPYISIAYRLGIINGTETEAGLCFNPKDAVSYAEAATILARLMDIGKPVSSALVGEYASIPAWARDSVAVLCENGIINKDVSASSALSRAETAKMLYNAKEFEK